MPARPQRRSSLITRLAVPAALVTCLGLFAVGRLVLGPPGQAVPALSPTAPALPTQPGFFPAAATESQPPASPEGETAAVVRVVDGDTIDVVLNGLTLPVRYIGVNTPEQNEACSTEATLANARLVEGQTVRLVKDVSDHDLYDRLLRYVYVGEVFVNAELVAQGYAEAVDFPPDTRYSDKFHALEAQARASGLGCHPSGVFDETATPLTTQPPAQGGAGGGEACDPAYPTVCIPPYPPDLDCNQIGFRHFLVLPPDPHGFDGDHDGIGCQS